jgi:glycine reductase complex component B subunit alpha and beta
MRLEVASFVVDDLQFGSTTGLIDRTLVIDQPELETLLAEDPSFASIRVELARPGENVRIVHAIDQIEPRLKLEGGPTFPGLLGPPVTAGSGRTHRLANVAVIQAGEFPVEVKGLLSVHESVVDMSGPGQAYSPFGSTLNVVLAATPAAGLDNERYDASLRLAGLKTAVYLAEATRNATPDQERVYELTEVDPSLPRVVYINQLQSQGIFARTFIYGHHGNELLPTFIHPNELVDGALVNGVYVYASVNTPTYLHCNNPVLDQLYRAHGSELNFVGTVISKGHNYSHTLKERSANYAANLANMLRPDGAILTLEGSGNSYVDVMLTVKRCEELGIKTTLLVGELGGHDGADQPLTMSLPEADAMVTVGGADRLVELPAMERAIGGETMRDYRAEWLPATSAATLALEQVCCSINQLGPSKLSTEAY